MQNLRELRKAHGLTTEQLAKIVGCSNATITNYELGNRQPDQKMLFKLADYFGVTVDYLLGRESPAQPSHNGKWINVYGEIAAGIPIEAVEDVIDQEEISLEMAEHGEYIALKVKGSSMEPRIADGDVVIIRLQETVENNEIAAVFVNGDSVTLKRVRKENDGLWLIPTNSAHSPLFYSKKDCDELPVRILGKLVEVRQKY